MATGYLDEEESRAFAATEGTGLIYSFQTSAKEGKEINESGKEDRVREGEFRSETLHAGQGIRDLACMCRGT